MDYSLNNVFLTLNDFFPPKSEEDFQERRIEIENLMKKNSDWIWDWSSRPENSPPKYVITFDHI